MLKKKKKTELLFQVRNRNLILEEKKKLFFYKALNALIENLPFFFFAESFALTKRSVYQMVTPRYRNHSSAIFDYVH